jgi:carbon monoxide dehydrogenase subunit G
LKVEYRFPLPLSVEQAWPTLLDMRRVVPCVPGASIESGDNQEFVGLMKVKLGPIEMNYRGTVQMIKRDDAAHEAVLGATAKEAKGAGSVTSTITLRLAATAAGSEVTVLSDFTLSGKAAQFGGSVINDVGAKLFKEFANRLATRIKSEAAAVPAPSIAPVAQATQPPRSNPPLPVAIPVLATLPQNEALDLVAVAWWPVVKRWLLPVAVVLALVAWLVARSVSSRA